jgi:hypothetical protein
MEPRYHDPIISDCDSDGFGSSPILSKSWPREHITWLTGSVKFKKPAIVNIKMVRNKSKWSVWLCYLTIFRLTNSLPVDRNAHKLIISDSEWTTIQGDLPTVINNDGNEDSTRLEINVVDNPEVNTTAIDETNQVRQPSLRNTLRPGLVFQQYNVEIKIDGDNFEGRVVFRATVTTDTREDVLKLHSAGLEIKSVRVGVSNEDNAVDAKVNIDGDVLEIKPNQWSSTYFGIIEYSGNLKNGGFGLFTGEKTE